jgi:hypothetical protein
MSENARKCKKMQENARKCKKMQENAILWRTPNGIKRN